MTEWPDRGGKANDNYRHGHCDKRMSPTYNSWRAMKERCLNPGNIKYHRYGGRGVGVCQRWLTFANFLADMGERPAGLTLDRKDNEKDYGPDNCRWATLSEQRRNLSTNNWITLFGRTQCLSDWCREFNTPNALASVRHSRLGWSWEKAITTPVRPTKKRSKGVDEQTVTADMRSP